MHIITEDNLYDAQDALRDILNMFFNMTAHQTGFFHGTDVGSFDPLVYIDAKTIGRSNFFQPIDIELLQTGSAISLLCSLYDIWNETENLEVPYAENIKNAVLAGRFSHLQDIEALLNEVFARNLDWQDTWLHEALPPIYQKYVIGFFERLLSDRSL